MKLPRIFLTGAPAAGKTTQRKLLLDHLGSRGYRPASLGIEEIHRELLPPDSDTSDYRYDDSGALILLKPAVQIPRSLALLQDRCSAATEKAGFVLELAHHDLLEALSGFSSIALEGALLLHLSAPTELRVQRNRKRTFSHIPTNIVTAYPSDLTTRDQRAIIKLGCIVELLDAAQPVKRVSSKISAIVDSHLRSTSHSQEEALSQHETTP